MKFFKYTIFLFLFSQNVFADQLHVYQDTSIYNGNYSENASGWGNEWGIGVETNNLGQPWNVAVSGDLYAQNNRANLWISGSGNAYFHSANPNEKLRFIFTGSIGDAGINNQGGKLFIDGGKVGGEIFVGGSNSVNSFGLENLYASSNTHIKNMDIYSDNYSTGGDYAIGVNNQGKYKFSSDLNNVFSFKGNNNSNDWVAGFYSAGKASAPTAKFEIIGMNLNIEENVARGANYGIGTANIDILGTEKGNTYIYKKNKSNNSMASALYLWNNGSEARIENMDFIIGENTANSFPSIFVGTNSSLNVKGGGAKGNLFHFYYNQALTQDFSAVVGLSGSILSFKDTGFIIYGNSAAVNFYGLYFNNGAVINAENYPSLSLNIGYNEAETGNNYSIFNGAGELKISDMDVSFFENIALNGTSYGIFNRGNLIIENKHSQRQLLLDNLDFGIYADGDGSKNTLKNVSARFSDTKNAIVLESGADLSIENSLVDIMQANGITVRSDASKKSEIKFVGSRINAEKTYLLKSLADSRVKIEAEKSTLNGRVFEEDTSQIEFSLKENSLWNVLGDSKVKKLDVEKSAINLYGGKVFVDDYLSGENALIKTSVYFSGPNSYAGNLIINNTSSGKNFIEVNPIFLSEGEIDKTGILVIEQRGADADSLADFSLYGGVLDSGFYEYVLKKGDLDGNGNNYYLRTQSVEPSSIGKTSLDVPAIHLSTVKFGMNELQRRLGELRDNSPTAKHGAWVRTYAQNLEVKDNSKATMNLYGIEGGYDYQIYSSKKDKVFLGAMIGYQYTDDIKIDQQNKKEGKGNVKAASVGVYTTWLNNEGYFSDVAVRQFFSDMKIQNTTSQDAIISYNSNRGYTAVDLEFGKRWEYGINSAEKIIIEPKTVFEYIYSKSDKVRANQGNIGRYSHTESKVWKNALSIYYHIEDSSCRVYEPFIQFAVLHEFDGKSNVVFNEIEADSSLKGTSYEFGGGLNIKLNHEFNLYSEVMYEKGSYVKSLSGNLGIRYSF